MLSKQLLKSQYGFATNRILGAFYQVSETSTSKGSRQNKAYAQFSLYIGRQRLLIQTPLVSHHCKQQCYFGAQVCSKHIWIVTQYMLKNKPYCLRRYRHITDHTHASMRARPPRGVIRLIDVHKFSGHRILMKVFRDLASLYIGQSTESLVNRAHKVLRCLPSEKIVIFFQNPALVGNYPLKLKTGFES